MSRRLLQNAIAVNYCMAKIEKSQNACRIKSMAESELYPYAAQGRRLRLLRQAEGFKSSLAFAIRMKWPQSSIVHFETGRRRVPMDKVLELRNAIPGFSPEYLWEGDKRNLPLDLRRRIEEQETGEPSELVLADSQR